MNFIPKRWLSAAGVAAAVMVLGAGLATARYESRKSANSPAATTVDSGNSDNGTAATTPAPPPVNPTLIPVGTPVRIQLDQTLDSARNQTGDVFEAHVAEPVVVDNRVVIPENAPVRGRVEDARPSGHFSHPGRLEVSLTKIKVDGEWREIATHEDSREGGNHKNNNAGWMGGGAGGGMLIGAIAAGGKGALIGGPIGVGAGAVAVLFTGKRDVHLPAETQLVFHLSKPLSVTPAPQG